MIYKAIIGDTDITRLIADDSYKVDSTEVYAEWIDGNKKKHKVLERTKVTGSFNVILRAGWTITDNEFIQLINNNVSENLLTITLWVQNLAKMESVRAYYSISTSETLDFRGNRITVYTVSLEEE